MMVFVFYPIILGVWGGCDKEEEEGIVKEWVNLISAWYLITVRNIVISYVPIIEFKLLLSWFAKYCNLTIFELQLDIQFH